MRKETAPRPALRNPAPGKQAVRDRAQPPRATHYYAPPPRQLTDREKRELYFRQIEARKRGTRFTDVWQ